MKWWVDAVASLVSLRAFQQGKWRTALSLQPEQKVRSSCGCLLFSGLQETTYGYKKILEIQLLA